MAKYAIPDSVSYLFNETGAKRWLLRNRGPRANALLPLTYSDRTERTKDYYAYSLDPRVLKLTERLGDRLTQEFKASVTEDGFAGDNGVPGDFYALRNVSGCGMDPLPIPVSDNAALIQSNGLATEIRPQDEPWLKELIRLFFGHVAPANLHIRKAASTGFPYFTSDIQYKKLGVLKCLKNVDHFLSLITGNNGDLDAALEEYHALLVYAINERQQPNAIIKQDDGSFKSKARTAPTEEEARSGSYAGKTVADMTVRDEFGNVIEGHFAMRRRDVFGMSGIINYFFTAIVGCNREVYLNRFAYTYKTRDRLDKEAKVARYSHVVGSDVKTMDKMIPEWFTRFMVKELANYWDERLVVLFERMMRAPYVCPPPWRDTAASYNPVFGGDPRDVESFRQHVGLPSGIAINPDIGKLWMTFVYVILYRDVGALMFPTEVEAFLQGKNPNHALLDMSDDATFLTNSAVTAGRLLKAKSPYVVLEPEQPVIYLGDVFTKVGGERKAYPNPVTYVVNALCREDSIDRQHPVAYAEGVLARYHTYSASPIFRDLNAIYEEEVKNALGINPLLIARGLAKMQRFSDVDALVKMSPGVLHYKVDPKDVSPAVLDEIVATIPASDFFNEIRHLFKVPTAQLQELE